MTVARCVFVSQRFFKAQLRLPTIGLLSSRASSARGRRRARSAERVEGPEARNGLRGRTSSCSCGRYNRPSETIRIFRRRSCYADGTAVFSVPSALLRSRSRAADTDERSRRTRGFDRFDFLSMSATCARFCHRAQRKFLSDRRQRRAVSSTRSRPRQLAGAAHRAFCRVPSQCGRERVSGERRSKSYVTWSARGTK